MGVERTEGRMLGYADIAGFGLVEVGKEDGGTDGHGAGNVDVGWVRVGDGVRFTNTETVP